MKTFFFRLVLLVPMLLIASTTLTPQIIIANHGSDSVALHWKDADSIEGSGEIDGVVFSKSGETDDNVFFIGVHNPGSIQNCRSDEHIVIRVQKDAYENVNPPQGVPIDDVSGGSRPEQPFSGCSYMADLVDRMEAQGTIGFDANSDDSDFEQQAGEGDEEDDNSCESKGGILGWVMCPVILAMDSGFTFLDSLIGRLLEVDEERYNNEGLQTAAANIRRIAFSILIPIMLVMVISTALGFDFVSAYTVKKALPRLMIAVIFIAVSFPLLSFFIEFIDAVGAGVMGLLTSPFKSPDTVDLLSLGDLFGSDGVGGFLTTLPSNFALGGGIIVFLAFFYPVILASAAIAFGLLMLRQIFIVGLLMVAPLAILAWIFPGNDKLWNGWWSAFSKLLFVYPLIIAIIAIGRIFASIILEPASPAGAEGAIITPIMGLVAYVAPYAFIPFAFKTAGGVFGNLAGMADGKAKGFFDKQRQKRAEKRERWSSNRAINAQKYAKGTRRRWAADKLNAGASSIMDPKSAAKIYAGTTGGKALLNQIGQSKMEDTQKLGESISKAGMNDRALKALSTGIYDSNGNQVIKAWDGTAKDMDRVVKDMNNFRKPDGTIDGNMALGAKQLKDNSAYLTQVSRSEEYGRASVAGAAGLALASQGFATPDDIAKVSNILDEESPGVGSMFKTQAELAGARAGALTKPGYSVAVGADGKFVAGDEGRRLARIKGMGVQDIGSAKAPQLETYHDDFTNALSGGSVDGKPVDAQTAADIESTLTQAFNAYTNPDIKNQVRSILTDAEKIKVQKEIGDGHGPVINDAEIKRRVDLKLSRAGRLSPDEDLALRGEPEPPQPLDN